MEPTWKKPRGTSAAVAWQLVTGLQQHILSALTAASELQPIEWLRDDGRHGGGIRYAAADSPSFNRASVNASSVHYDDQERPRHCSTTALSAIIHPQHPRAPSLHMHVSWTETQQGSGYWRVMADLNPALPETAHAIAFEAALRDVAPELHGRAAAAGAAYFFIPALHRHRGVVHYYLEGHDTGDFVADSGFARRFGAAAAGAYARIVDAAVAGASAPSDDERAAQLGYHTAYLLQVLTLDRGTTAGLLAHDQNDLGILGSLPSRIDRALLRSWIAKLPAPQDRLLRALVAVLPDEMPCRVSDETRAEIADVIREHYRAHPEALALLASGPTLPKLSASRD